MDLGQIPRVAHNTYKEGNGNKCLKKNSIWIYRDERDALETGAAVPMEQSVSVEWQ
jgi:hypothetical protein